MSGVSVMGVRGKARKYGAVMRIAMSQTWSRKIELGARVAFFGIILLIFSRLWRVALSSQADALGKPEDYLWYLAITEWVIISVHTPHQDIEREIRSGDLAYRLPRPISYVGAHVAEAAGVVAVNLLAVGMAGVPIAWTVAGKFPDAWGGLVCAVPVGILAALVLTVCHVTIGLTAIWLHTASPIFWIFQKLCFVLGGLIVPMTLYPGWLQSVAAWTPFPAIVYGPGQLALHGDPAVAVDAALRLAGWGVAAAGFLGWLYQRALRVLDVNGG